MKPRKLGIFSLAYLVFFLAFAAAGLVTAQQAKADWVTFENIGNTFTSTGIDDSILPGLGTHLDLKLTVDIPPNFTGAIDQTQIKSFVFTCGSQVWDNSKYTLSNPSPMNFINGKPVGFCDVGIIDPTINSTLQMLVVTGDTENIVTMDINGGLSALAIKKDGQWYLNISIDPSPWVEIASLPGNVPLPPSVLLLLLL